MVIRTFADEAFWNNREPPARTIENVAVTDVAVKHANVAGLGEQFNGNTRRQWKNSAD